jgi:hypothetical protein
MFVRPASTSTRERPLAMSSASETRTIAASIVSGLPRERCEITACIASATMIVRSGSS